MIAPKKKETIGVNNLNLRLQQALNGGSKTEVKFRNQVLRVGDKVMQTRNNYDKEVFNGDIGFVHSIDTEANTLKVRFDYERLAVREDQVDGRFDKSELDRFLELPPDSDLITYQFSEADDLMLAYCITVHKSQGSEFPVVVMPVFMRSNRGCFGANLLYTAISRAKTAW